MDEYNLEPKTFVPVRISFQPTENKKYESILEVTTSAGIFTYKLIGEGYGFTPTPTTPKPTEPGTDSGSQIPKATLLTSEFYNNQDLDGDGKIYGYDFKISDDDSKPPKKPIILCIVEKSPYWTNPTIEISWEEFSK